MSNITPIDRRVIKADGTIIKLDRPHTMRELHQLIGAECVGTVNLRDKAHHVMILDDQGAFMDLPINKLATEIYHGVCRTGVTHCIRGDVVIIPDSDFAPGGHV